MRPLPVTLALAALAASPRVALADDAPPPATTAPAEPPDELAALRAPPDRTYQFLATLFFGDGLRFNNPYRLKTQLGDSARSLSLTAPYIDIGVGATLGRGNGLQHGAALNLTASLNGVGQAVLVPSYLATYRTKCARFLGFGRFGPAIILTPDPNFGAELAAGAALFLTAKVAVTAEAVGNLFYGAATPTVGYPVYPILSFQLGLLVDHEVLP